jgi:hypothetical protein
VTLNECPSCGRELTKDMMFCPYCGTKMHSESVSAESDRQEQVKGVIPLAKSRDGAEGWMFSLILTNSRLIFARVTEEDDNKVRNASSSVLLGGSILEPERHRKSLGSYSRRFQGKDPESILKESEGNYFLKFTEVKGIRISSEDDAEGNQFYLISFETSNETKKFLITNDRDSRDLLISTFADKVHW